DLLARAAIDDDLRTRLCKPGRDRKADAGGRACDHRALIAQIDFHDGPLKGEESVIGKATSLCQDPATKVARCRSADYGLKPVPPHRWHFTLELPSLMRPLPSQFLHFIFFVPAFFCMCSPIGPSPRHATKLA